MQGKAGFTTRLAAGARHMLLALAASLATGTAQAQALDEFQWLSEEFAPFNFSENGVAKGIAVDVLVEMWARLGVPRTTADIQMLPWARGYRIAQEQPGTCLFSMSVTEARRELFAFVEPLLDARIAIIAPKSRALALSSMDDLAPLAIGVVREDIGEHVLVQAEAPGTLMRADSARSLVRMLAGGRFDAIAYGLDSALWAMRLEGLDPSAYEAVLTLRDGPMGYACHKDTDPAIIARLQATMEALIADGTVERIRERYLQ